MNTKEQALAKLDEIRKVIEGTEMKGIVIMMTGFTPTGGGTYKKDHAKIVHYDSGMDLGLMSRHATNELADLIKSINKI